MALRLVEVLLPADVEEDVGDRADSYPVVDAWSEPLSDGRSRVGFLVEAGAAEPLMDELEQDYGAREGFRLVVQAVEASLPRPEPEETEEPGPEAGEDDVPSGRIGREELHADLAESARLTPVYAAMTALSALVCAAGLVMDDVAVVIGAMVIAPILGPLVALSLATTLADADLASDGIRAGLGGLGIAFLLSVVIGLWAPVTPGIPAVEARSSVTLGHVGLALAAGSAGTLAFTTGTAAAVIGVMVAVALVPPLVAGGLLLGAGYPVAGAGALLLVATNLICVNLAGVATFLIQGIRPNRWWEAERARKATLVALVVWTALLAALVALILLEPFGP